MTKSRTGNNKFLKKYNETGILDLIRVHKALSRAELSLLTGLSPTAVGMITAGLLEKGCIHETGIGESKGGRRPVMLELKPRSFYSAGIDLDIKSISLALIDITGQKIGAGSCPMVPGADPAQTAKKIRELVVKALDDAGESFDRLLGIGISVPGMIDGESRKVLLAPNLGWKDVDIRQDLASVTGIPVYVENEAMASAICENWIGSCRGVNNFVCINIKSGIGAGIFTDGRLYRGTGGSAGEVGHIVVVENGPRCGCGNYGCLETMASTAHIVEEAKKLVKRGELAVPVKPGSELTIDTVAEAARAGNKKAEGILADSAVYLGLALSNIINTLNPSRIVLGKDFTRYSDLVMDRLKDVVSCKALKTLASRVSIEASEIGEESSTLGAAIIPLKVLFGK